MSGATTRGVLIFRATQVLPMLHDIRSTLARMGLTGSDDDVTLYEAVCVLENFSRMPAAGTQDHE